MLLRKDLDPAMIEELDQVQEPHEPYEQKGPDNILDNQHFLPRTRTASLMCVHDLAKDGDGVDRSEFLMGMLVAMECAELHECEALMARFNELDVDG
jgi:hypothetical protein